MVFGQNLKLPSLFNDKSPALHPRIQIKILTDNLNALHKAKEALISSENSEKIHRALTKIMRTSGDAKYFVGGQNALQKGQMTSDGRVQPVF